MQAHKEENKYLAQPHSYICTHTVHRGVKMMGSD